MLQRRLSRQLPDPYYEESQSEYFNEAELQPSEPKEQTTGPTQDAKDPLVDRHKTKRYRQKMRKQFVNKRIVELENQIKDMTENQELCRRCRKLLALPHCLDLDNRKQTELQFEGFPTGRLQRLKQLKGQIWIVLGLLMLILGVHLHGLEGGAHSYKLLQNDLKDFTENIENSDDMIHLPIYYQILDSQIESHNIMTVDSSQLMFEQSMDVSVRYDDLIRIMESLKGFFQSWYWM